MLRILIITSALGAAVFFGLLRFHDNLAAAADADDQGRAMYCEMVDIWRADAARGIPEAQRYGWPPEGVHGRNYVRDCGGVK